MIDKLELAWIVVADIQKAVQFYTEVIGMKLREFSKEYGWAELMGHNGGSLLGIAQANNKDGVSAGDNAIVTLSVKDIDAAKKELAAKGVQFLGDIIEVPNIVKLQMFIDTDGNKLQLVQSFN